MDLNLLAEAVQKALVADDPVAKFKQLMGSALDPSTACHDCAGGWGMPDSGCKACNNTGWKDGKVPVSASPGRNVIE